MASKKRKMTHVAAASSTRPIDKTITALTHTLSTTQTDVILTTATGPCTIRGLRWNLWDNSSGTASDLTYWVIYRLKEGYTVPTISTTNNTQLMEPEQEVLVWGVLSARDGDAGTGSAMSQDKGETKSMRKLMSGDRLMLSTRSIGNAGATFNGAVQFFCLY